MTKYSIKKLADLAGVSVRTLHHYDQIGLLIPSTRSEKGYRFYDHDKLLLLQQILLYRELGFNLKEINSIINDPSFNLLHALFNHQKALKEQLSNLKQMIKTVDKTIVKLKKKEKMNDQEIYQGFKSSDITSIKEEVIRRWGKEKLTQVEERIKNMGKEGWKDTHKKGEEINNLLADLMSLPVEHIQVQKAVNLHFRHLNLFYSVSKKRYLELGQMYIEDQRFKAHYEKYTKGLAQYLNSAIQIFCDHDLKVL